MRNLDFKSRPYWVCHYMAPGYVVLGGVAEIRQQFSYYVTSSRFVTLTSHFGGSDDLPVNMAFAVLELQLRVPNFYQLRTLYGSLYPSTETRASASRQQSY